MPRIELDQKQKDEIAGKLKDYLAEELNLEIGSFDAQFLLEFFSEQVGYQFYNQGLADALTAMEGKIEEFSDLIYQLEQEGPGK